MKIKNIGLIIIHFDYSLNKYVLIDQWGLFKLMLYKLKWKWDKDNKIRPHCFVIVFYINPLKEIMRKMVKTPKVKNSLRDIVDLAFHHIFIGTLRKKYISRQIRKVLKWYRRFSKHKSILMVICIRVGIMSFCCKLSLLLHKNQ